MRIFSTLKRGDTHPTHCDDHLVYHEFGNDLFIAAVMDGCSSGVDSYFAATLLGKLLNKLFSTLPYPQVSGMDVKADSTERIIQYVCKTLFREIVQTQNALFLDKHELLSTLMVAIYKPTTQQLSIASAGDGVHCVNGQVTIIDHDNKPNYLAYHLVKDVNDWFENEVVLTNHEQVSDFSISTDGVESFANESLQGKGSDFDAINYLLNDTQLSDNPAMLHKKCIALATDHQLIPRDDVAIVRVME